MRPDRIDDQSLNGLIICTAMHRAYFTLDFTEKSDETVIVVYLSHPSIVIGPTGKEKTRNGERREAGVEGGGRL